MQGGGALLLAQRLEFLRCGVAAIGLPRVEQLLRHLGVERGTPVRLALGTRYTPEAYEALRQASGLDRPILEQFFSYVGNALTGNLGVSFRNGEPVTTTLLQRLPATISLALAGLVMLVTPGPGWLFIFLGLGIWSTEFEWAHRLNMRIKRAALRMWRWWSNLVAEWRYRRARDKPHGWEQGPRHMRATTPDDPR